MQWRLVIFLYGFLVLSFAFSDLFLLHLLGVSCILPVYSKFQPTDYFGQLIICVIIICTFIRGKAV